MSINFKNLKMNVPLANYVTIRVGGNAHFFVEPQKISELIKIVKYCIKQKINYFILGNGSNVIFSDRGFDGIVICTKKLNKINVKKNIVKVECGTNLYVLNKFLINNALSGMEFTYGIPGTVGGAVCMNAGAYGFEMKDIIQKVMYFDGKKIKTKNIANLDFSYRNSYFKKNNFIVLKVWLKLNKKNILDVQNLCMQNFKKRQISQPLEFANSGSIFKKVNGVSAGKIIDDLGLKGKKCGGAQVSTLHANFIINKNNATSQDVKNLIDEIKKEVKEKAGISLEEEVIIIP